MTNIAEMPKPTTIVFGTDGNLSLHDDPKTAWALAHPERSHPAAESRQHRMMRAA